MTAEQVIRLIEDGWREVPYPGDDKIRTPDSIDDDGIVSYFAGTTWRGHAPANLRANSSAFSFFSPDAFHYWLPAFLIAAINDPEEADVVVEYIAWSVRDHYPAGAWPLFSRAQRQALMAYFRFQIERFPNGNEYECEALGILEQGEQGHEAD